MRSGINPQWTQRSRTQGASRHCWLTSIPLQPKVASPGRAVLSLRPLTRGYLANRFQLSCNGSAAAARWLQSAADPVDRHSTCPDSLLAAQVVVGCGQAWGSCAQPGQAAGPGSGSGREVAQLGQGCKVGRCFRRREARRRGEAAGAGDKGAGPGCCPDKALVQLGSCMDWHRRRGSMDRQGGAAGSYGVAMCPGSGPGSEEVQLVQGGKGGWRFWRSWRERAANSRRQAACPPGQG